MRLKSLSLVPRVLGDVQSRCDAACLRSTFTRAMELAITMCHLIDGVRESGEARLRSSNPLFPTLGDVFVV